MCLCRGTATYLIAAVQFVCVRCDLESILGNLTWEPLVTVEPAWKGCKTEPAYVMCARIFMSQHQTVSNCIFTHCYSENRTVTTAAISVEHIAPHSMFSGMGHKIVFLWNDNCSFKIHDVMWINVAHVREDLINELFPLDDRIKVDCLISHVFTWLCEALKYSIII